MKSSYTKKIELQTITTSAAIENTNIPLIITRPSSANTINQARNIFQTTSHTKSATSLNHNSSNSTVRLPEFNLPKKMVKRRIIQTESKSTSSTNDIKKQLQLALTAKIKKNYSTNKNSKTKKNKKITVYRVIKDPTQRPRITINTPPPAEETQSSATFKP